MDDKDYAVMAAFTSLEKAAYRKGRAAGRAEMQRECVAVCKHRKEVASWSDQTKYYRGRQDEASDCATDIEELTP